MAKSKGTRYSVTLSPQLEEDLNRLTEKHHITKSEALRRSIMLFKHAVEAEEVSLTYADKTNRRVLVK